MGLEYKEQMKFIVYKAKSTTKKELLGSSAYLANETIPNSKMTMYFMKADKSVVNENNEEVLERGNIQVYHDAKRNLIFAENTSISESVHDLLFKDYEVHGNLDIPGKKEANNQFVKKMLTMIRAYK